MNNSDVLCSHRIQTGILSFFLSFLPSIFSTTEKFIFKYIFSGQKLWKSKFFQIVKWTNTIIPTMNQLFDVPIWKCICTTIIVLAIVGLSVAAAATAACCYIRLNSDNSYDNLRMKKNSNKINPINVHQCCHFFLEQTQQTNRSNNFLDNNIK